MASHEIGQYTIEDNGTDLVIKDEAGTTQARYDKSADEWVDIPAISAEEVNGTLRQGASESVQAAVDRATAGDKVMLRSGTFAENVEIATADLTVVGAGRGTLIDGGTSGNAIRISASGVTVRGVAVQTTSGGGSEADAIQNFGFDDVLVDDIWVEGSDDRGVFWNNASGGRIINIWVNSANVDGNDVNLNSGCSGNVVDDIIGSVSDNGTNTIGETA